MRITSLGFRTDVALRVLEGAEVIDRRYGISGAQPAETFLHALRTAYAAEEPATR